MDTAFVDEAMLVVSLRSSEKSGCTTSNSISNVLIVLVANKTSIIWINDANFGLFSSESGSDRKCLYFLHLVVRKRVMLPSEEEGEGGLYGGGLVELVRDYHKVIAYN